VIPRGVSSIEREVALDELDSNRVQEIVTEVFQQKNRARPYSIDFRYRGSADSKAQAYLDGNTLHVIASTKPALKRLIGRFVIRQSWSSHDWSLLSHTDLYALTSLVLLITLPAISYLLAYAFLDYRVWIVMVTLALIIVFSIWAANQISRKSVKLLRKFTTEMADLNCMTEYDSKDYTGDPHLVAIGGTIICTFGTLVSILLSTTYYLQDAFFVGVPIIVLLLSAMYFLIAPIWMSIDSNLCYQSDAADEQEEEEADDDKFEDNQYLHDVFKDLIEKMDLKRSISSKHGAEFNEIRARFSETRYAQCRGIYDYIEEGTLFIDIEDLNLNAARRYGTALLATGSIPFYTELSLKRRIIQLVAFFFGLIMLLVALIGSLTLSKEFSIGALLFTSVVFTWMWHIGWKQNEQARRDLPRTLRKTEVFKEYEVHLYSDMMFSMTARFDIGLLTGFLTAFLVLGTLILVFL
jgi:hypothetical protein